MTKFFNNNSVDDPSPSQMLASGAIGRGDHKKYLAMLWAYFDDSGTHKGSKYNVLGGLVGDEEQWRSFDNRWNALLKKPLEGKSALKMWSSADCQNANNEFTGYTRAESDSVTFKFRQIIMDSDLVTFAVAVDQTAWDELMGQEVFKIFFGTASECAFMQCMDFCVNCTRFVRGEDRIGVVFDAGWVNLKINERAENYLTMDEITSITAAKVKDQPGLQGADMVAAETYWFTHEWVKPENNQYIRPHFHQFKDGPLSKGIFIDRDAIQKMANLFLQRLSPTL